MLIQFLRSRNAPGDVHFDPSPAHGKHSNVPPPLYRRRYPTHPLILVTRWTRENGRHLHRCPVDEVVWLEDGVRSWASAAIRACEGDPLSRLALAIAGATHISPLLRSLLARACHSRPPITSVAQLARLGYCHRSTLASQWRRAVGPDTQLDLSDILRMILLVHASRNSGVKAGAHAAELGIHEDTLRRISRRYLNRARPRLEDTAAIVGALLNLLVS